MASYLGLYIENNTIKYAKISKERNQTRIDSYGLKFYSDLNRTIEQIIAETNSRNAQISVNLSDETYQQFDMFAQLNKKDLDKAIKLEFDSYCTEKGYNSKSLEMRYVCVDNVDDVEKIRVLNVTKHKDELNRLKQNFNGYKLSTISPVPMTIPNLLELSDKENVLIVNLEDKATITTMHGKNIYDIQVLDEGSTQITEKINQRENSYAETYDILRNTTIYTNDAQITAEPSFDDDNATYLEDIMPVIYNVVAKVQSIIAESIEKIDKVYITGTLSSINNIDIYFQQYLIGAKCEILKPYFLKNSYNREVNVKEYAEVNSAISLALQASGEGISGINFRQYQLKEALNQDVFGTSSKPKGGNKTKIKYNFKDFDTAITKTEVGLIRIIIAALLFIIIYVVFSNLLLNQITEKQEEVSELIDDIQDEIIEVSTDTAILNNKAEKYSALIEQLNSINTKISEISENRDLIPNLLNQIMTVVDESVQITSISNPTDKHIVIEAQSPTYPGLGYFKTKLKINNILENVVSGSSMKQGDVVTVTIEGDLP